jgi:hydrogenase/urease accessory protein HupE
MNRLAAIGPRLTTLLLVLFASLCARAAEAHQIGLSRGQYTALADGLEARLVFDGDELGRVVDDRAGGVAGTAIDSTEARAVLERRIVQQIRVSDDERRPCAGTLRRVKRAEKGGVVLFAAYRCMGLLDASSVALEFWDELLPGHRHLASATDPNPAQPSAAGPSAANPNLASPGGEAREQILYRERPRLELSAVPAPKRLSPLEWIELGVQHILGGYDHLAFLLALVLVTPALRTLTATVSVFTVAHSVTLALSTLQVIAPPPGLVECAIALSISYVGLENLTERARRPRFTIVFVFGLIHGFGFAGALAELGLPQAQTPAALFAFNIGVELGQLAVLAVAYPVIQQLCKTRWFVPRGVPAISLCTALAGMVWFFDRV